MEIWRIKYESVYGFVVYVLRGIEVLSIMKFKKYCFYRKKYVIILIIKGFLVIKL